MVIWPPRKHKTHYKQEINPVGCVLPAFLILFEGVSLQRPPWTEDRDPLDRDPPPPGRDPHGEKLSAVQIALSSGLNGIRIRNRIFQ